ncbi:calcium-activated chloride channel regulator 1-like [Scylla paramamosain]|uniref:calcium-activated chloride channel regulator 1-like n=1 Tax=Scylla paramamosain TaxID=85552 RepID=UPI00308350F6
MGVRAAVMVVVSVVMATGVAAAPQDGITLTTGYQGVTVAISDQLDQNQCAQYIDSIKAMITAASSLLFTATGGKVFFGDVVIVVPQQWACQGNPSQPTQLVYMWDSAHLRVGPSHYLFGGNPWTQQPGGCGEPGDWIYVPENFLLDNTNVGNPGNVLVHEWAKFRWGVFEEYGHLHDAIFPQVYLDDTNTITPTYCTDNQLEGAMSCSGDTEADCQFIPELIQNTSVTSSLLAAPFLDSVINFCDAATHNAAAPTKHNLLCDQSSVMDVIAWHTDMSGNSPISLASTNFTVVSAEQDWPRTVFLLEYTTLMASDVNGEPVVGRWEQLRDNVRQFILQEAAAESYVGVVMFGSKIEASLLLPLISKTNREHLASLIYESSPYEGSKVLGTAIQRGVQVLGPQGGTLVLLTQNLQEYALLPNENLVEAADNNPVWPILYPSNPSVPTQIYEQLAGISPDTSILTIQNDLITTGDYTYQSVGGSAGLHGSLLTAAGSPAVRVVSGNCQASSCTIPLQVNDNTAYISPAYVKVFKYQTDLAMISVTDPTGREINPADERNSAILYPISTLQNGGYQVSMRNSAKSMTVIAELWATPTPAPFDLEVSAWSPKGLHNLPYSKGSAPRLLATVTKNASSPVLFADVTAMVANKNTPGTPVNITLNDSGTGADVTGQDGIYSGYLVGFQPKDDVSITLTVTDNNGQAKMVDTSLRAAPTISGDVACCGSQLNVSSLQLITIGSFTFSSSAVSGRFTGVPPVTLPPGRVTDLEASRSGRDVTLSFTAPGAQLDQGQAEWYAVHCQLGGVDLSPIGNFSGVLAGSTVQDQVTLPGCNKVYTLTVVAYYNGSYGSASNAVREMAACSSTNNLSPGAIAGITIGCILGVLLIVLLVYLGLNSDHLDDLWVWRMLTCRCCPCCKDTKDDDDLYSPPSRARRTDYIRGNTESARPVRSLADLYSRPNVEAKKEQRQTRPQDEDDGGFGERMKQDKMQMKSTEDAESLASSRSTLPINQVGLPVGGDNHAYDDGPYTIYRNAPPVPAQRRANTQV